LTLKINNHTVFDLFYEKVLRERYHPSHAKNWHTSLETAIELVDKISDGDILKDDKKYVLRLQSVSRTLTKIFDLLVSAEFDMGDPEFLVYSIISRGELCKLKILGSLYVIEDYPAVLDVALRYGRHNIIQYFKDTLELDFTYYGKIMDFENYKDNPRYMYYKEHIDADDASKKAVIAGATKQDYVASVKLILSDYQYPITLNTIDKWCELIKSKEYLWDKINSYEIIPLLVAKLEGELPLSHDFGEFNYLIFGSKWSDRTCLVEHCLNLQRKLEAQAIRQEVLESQLKHLQLKYESIKSNKYRSIDSRIRRDTN